jgi:hypothetical protein
MFLNFFTIHRGRRVPGIKQNPSEYFAGLNHYHYNKLFTN